MDFLCIYFSCCTTLHVLNNYFVHHQEFKIYCICSSVQTILMCVTAQSYGWKPPTIRLSSYAYLNGSYRAADTVNYELLLMNEIVVRNMQSCTKIVEQIHKKCILLVCLYNMITCITVSIVQSGFQVTIWHTSPKLYTKDDIDIQGYYRKVSFYARAMFLKNVVQIKHKIKFKTVHFLGDRKLTISCYIVYDYTTCGHTDLQSIYLLYIQYAYILYNIFIYF